MKKLILFIMILFVQNLLAQTYYLKDTVVTLSVTVQLTTTQLEQLQAGGNLSDILQDILDLRTNQIDIISRLDAHDDSIAALRASIGFVTPTFPDAPINLTATGRTTDILVNWMDYQMTTPPDSFQLSIFNSDPSSGGDPIATTIYTTDTFYVFSTATPNTNYWFYVQAWLSNEFSNISNIDSAYLYEAPSGGGGGGYQSVLYAGLSATGSGDGSSRENQMSLRTATTVVVAGDTVILDDVLVADVTAQSLSFSRNGTSGNPIVWIGTIADSNYASLNAYGISSSMIYGNSTSNGVITISGDYNEFHKIIFKQGQPRQLITISGDYTTFDSCAFKYPSNTASSSNHLVRTSGVPKNLTVRHSHIYNSPRTAFWVEWTSTTDAPHNVLFENNVFKGHTSHPAFQIMPYTNIVSPAKINNVIVRNNLFDNIGYNPFYMRHCSNFKIYNNIFDDSGTPVQLPMHPVAPYDTSSTGLIAYNTAYNTQSSRINYLIYNEASQDLTVKNNLWVSTVPVYGNYIMRFQCWNGGALMPPNYSHDFDYNIYYVDTDPTFASQRFYYTPSVCGTVSSYTLAQWQALGFDVHSIIGRPTFVDEANGDFRHASINSVGANDGTPISGITTDKNGVTRNITTPSIGALEYAH